MTNSDILTLEEAGGILGVSKKVLTELSKRGNFPARKVGGSWRVLRANLEDWMKEAPMRVDVRRIRRVA